MLLKWLGFEVRWLILYTRAASLMDGLLMAKILVAEDDEKLGRMVQDWLIGEKCTVDLALDGREALDMLKVSTYDVIILDWDMPHVTGLEIVQQLRAAGKMTPTLLLTGKDGIEDKEQGFDKGADDYLTKPFHLKELSARIKALMRRPNQIAPQILEHGAFVFDFAMGRVLKNGKLIELFPKEFALLEFFVRHPNQVFSLEALQARIWASDSTASPDTIRVHIARLRSKLEEDGEESILKTVHRKGYMLEIPDSK